MEIARHWRLRQQRYNLVGSVCPHCDAKNFPPRSVCPDCGGEVKVDTKVKGGIVYSQDLLLCPGKLPVLPNK